MMPADSCEATSCCAHARTDGARTVLAARNRKKSRRSASMPRIISLSLQDGTTLLRGAFAAGGHASQRWRGDYAKITRVRFVILFEFVEAVAIVRRKAERTADAGG